MNIYYIKLFLGIIFSLQPSNIKSFFNSFLIVHLDISGNDINDLQYLNMWLISVTLAVFQLDISGNNINELQL